MSTLQSGITTIDDKSFGSYSKKVQPVYMVFLYRIDELLSKYGTELSLFLDEDIVVRFFDELSADEKKEHSQRTKECLLVGSRNRQLADVIYNAFKKPLSKKWSKEHSDYMNLLVCKIFLHSLDEIDQKLFALMAEVNKHANCKVRADIILQALYLSLEKPVDMLYMTTLVAITHILKSEKLVTYSYANPTDDLNEFFLESVTLAEDYMANKPIFSHVKW